MPARAGFAFGPFQLDPHARRLLRNGVDVPLPPRHFALLVALVTRAPDVLTKDELVNAAWGGMAIGDNSLNQAILRLRHALDPANPTHYIETVTRVGFRFVMPVTSCRPHVSDADLDALMVPHMALVDGRALIESLHLARIDQAIEVFTFLVSRDPQSARYQAGLANAYIWRYEATRTAETPDLDARHRALTHATEARRLDPTSAEAWAVYGFVLARSGDVPRGVAALDHATRLEPTSWRHWLRLADVDWGSDRLRALQRTLELFPRLPVAHAMATMVFIARDVERLAARELELGHAAVVGALAEDASLSCIALNWMQGLHCHARREMPAAMDWYQRELALEAAGHLYARECCANVCCDIGAWHRDQGHVDRAREAFHEAIKRVPRFPMAHAGLIILDGRASAATADAFAAIAAASGRPVPVEVEMARAAILDAAHDTPSAVRIVCDALAAAPRGSAGWKLPLDPMIGVHRNRELWAPALVALSKRAN